MSNTLNLYEEKNWLSLQKDLKQSVGDSAYNNWIKYLSFVSYENNTLSFSLPTKFLRDWIVNNYSDKIKIESKKYLDSLKSLGYNYILKYEKSENILYKKLLIGPYIKKEDALNEIRTIRAKFKISNVFIRKFNLD